MVDQRWLTRLWDEIDKSGGLPWALGERGTTRLKRPNGAREKMNARRFRDRQNSKVARLGTQRFS